MPSNLIFEAVADSSVGLTRERIAQYASEFFTKQVGYEVKIPTELDEFKRSKYRLAFAKDSGATFVWWVDKEFKNPLTLKMESGRFRRIFRMTGNQTLEMMQALLDVDGLLIPPLPTLGLRVGYSDSGYLRARWPISIAENTGMDVGQSFEDAITAKVEDFEPQQPSDHRNMM